MTGSNLTLTWANAPGVKLQKSSSVGASASWTDVPGAGSATEAIGPGSAYYRLIKP
jgi:hypothetical protein